MNILRSAGCLVVTLATTIGSSIAATGPPDSPSAGLGAWLFLGFCALIFVAQLIPALLLLFGMLKGLFGKENRTVLSGPRSK